MAENYPGPYQLRVFYDCAPAAFSTVSRVLQLNLDCDTEPTPGDAFSDIDIKRAVGTAVPLDNVTNALVNVLEDLCSSADTDITYAELWKYDALSFDATYISTYDISNAGVHADPGEAASQQTFTFRTLEGGVFKIVLLEQPQGAWQKKVYSDLSVAQQAFVDFFTDDSTSYWLGRDTSRPFVFMGLFAGHNEKLIRNRFR
jgi:hypothetical protein